MSIYKSIFKGLIISFVVGFLLLVLFATILTYSNLDESIIPATIIIITALSLFIGTSLSCMKLKKNGMVCGTIVGLIYMVIIYLISSIKSGNFGLNVNSIIMIILGIICGLIGGVIGVNKI